MIKATIQGRLTADPTHRENNGGSRVTTCNVACDTKQKDPSGQGMLTNFVHCSFWGQQGDSVLKYFHKGDGIIATGDLAGRMYAGQDGKQYMSLELLNATFEFPAGKRSDKPDPTKTATPAPAPAPTPVDDNDDLPF